MSEHHLFLMAAAITALIGAAADLRTGHIPDRLTLGALAAAPLVHGVAALLRTHSAVSCAQGVAFSLLGAMVCAILPVAMHRSGGIGGGDAKLFAAIGALANPLVGLHVETYAFVVGMVWAFFVVARSGRLASTLTNVMTLVGAPLRRGEKRELHPEQMTSLRFGPAILVGTLFAVVMCWRAT